MFGKRPTPIFRDQDTLFNRGIEALTQGRHHAAAGLFSQAASLAPKSAAIFLALGVALMRLYQIPQAQEALETAILLEPTSFYPHFRLGELYLRVGLNSKANAELLQASSLASNEEQRRVANVLLDIGARRRNPWT